MHVTRFFLAVGLAISAGCQADSDGTDPELSARMEALEQRADALEQELEATRARIPPPVTPVEPVDLQPLSADVEWLKSALETMYQDLADIDARVTSLETAPLSERFDSHGSSRTLRYDPSSGELWIVGEQAHGLDWFHGGGGFWWCSFANPGTAPLLSFLLREATVSNLLAPDPDFYPPGLEAPYTDPGVYSVLRVTPTSVQQALVSAVDGDYRALDPSTLDVFLYQGVDDTINVAVMGAGVEDQLADGEAEGDGTEDADNGVRIDIAFRGQVSLPASLLSWLGELTDETAPYETTHPTSF